MKNLCSQPAVIAFIFQEGALEPSITENVDSSAFNRFAFFFYLLFLFFNRVIKGMQEPENVETRLNLFPTRLELGFPSFSGSRTLLHVIICFKGLVEGSELNTTDRDRDGYEGQLD